MQGHLEQGPQGAEIGKQAQLCLCQLFHGLVPRQESVGDLLRFVLVIIPQEYADVIRQVSIPEKIQVEESECLPVNVEVLRLQVAVANALAELVLVRFPESVKEI